MGDLVVDGGRVKVGKIVVGGPPAPAGGPGDPFYNDVILLSDFEGTDGDTSITGQSPIARSISLAGGAEIDSAQAKYGSTSLYIPNSANSHAFFDSETLGNFELGSDDFTIEMDVRFEVAPGAGRPVTFISKADESAFGQLGFILALGTNIQFGVGATFAYINVLDFAWSPSINQWYHLAVVRSGSTGYIFIDGTLLGSNPSAFTVSSATIPNIAADVRIGDRLDGVGSSIQNLGGWIDNIRVTQGVARYTSAFTPPAAAHPTST